MKRTQWEPISRRKRKGVCHEKTHNTDSGCRVLSDLYRLRGRVSLFGAKQGAGAGKHRCRQRGDRRHSDVLCDPSVCGGTAVAKTQIEAFFRYKTLADSSLRAAVIELGLTTDERLERIRPICGDMDVSIGEYYAAVKKYVMIDTDYFCKVMLAPGDCKDEMLFDNRKAVPQKTCTVIGVTEIDRAPYGDTDRIDYRVVTEDDKGAETVYRVRFVQYAGEYCLAACDSMTA